MDDLVSMNSRQPHIRTRPLWVAVSLFCVFAVVLGFASAPASARTMARTKLIITSSTPAQPVAGKTYTITFQVSKLGTAYPLMGVGCYAQAGGRAVPVLAQAFSGTVGRCSFSIPAGAAGKTLDGIIAAQQASTGTWYYRGIAQPIS
jgi:hypothetical protein